MSKYERQLKVEQLRKYAIEGTFQEDALEICDSLNWKRERNHTLLAIGANVYEAYRRYEKALFLLERLYKISGARRKNAEHLIELALEYGDYNTAAYYLEEYKRVAPQDRRGILLEYRIANGKLGAESQILSKEETQKKRNEVIAILEKYAKDSCEEEWIYELAEQYHRAGRQEECIAMCDQLSLWFSVGPYVEKALKLKTLYVPLSEEQREKIRNRHKYEKRWKEFVSDLKSPEEVPEIITKEEARERAEKRAGAVEGTSVQEENGEAFVMTHLEELEEPEKPEDVPVEEESDSKPSQENDTEGGPSSNELFLEKARNFQVKDNNISIESMDKIQRLKQDFEQLAENVQKKAALPKPSEKADLTPSKAAREEMPAAEPEAEEAPKQETRRRAEAASQGKTESAREAASPTDSDEDMTDLGEETFRVVETRVRGEKETDKFSVSSLQSIGHFTVKSEYEKQGIQLAVSIINQKIREGEPLSDRIALTSGKKLNLAGIGETLKQLSGVTLLIERAGALSESSLWDLNVYLEKVDLPVLVVLVDSSDGIEGIWKKNESLKEKFHFRFSSRSLSIERLTEYGVSYAASKNCVIDDMALIPLYDALEDLSLDDQTEDKKKFIEEMVDRAIQNASAKGLRQRISSFFFVRQDDQGRTILRESDFR